MLKICSAGLLIFTVLLVPVLMANAETDRRVERKKNSKEEESFNYVKLRDDIDKKKKELDKLEIEVALKEQVFESLKVDITQLVAKVNRLNDQVEEKCTKIRLAKENQFSRMVKVYESMAPEDSAARIEFLDKVTVNMLMNKMKSKKVAQILSFMQPKTAARFSTELMK